jgi:hypothetical protein
VSVRRCQPATRCRRQRHGEQGCQDEEGLA